MTVSRLRIAAFAAAATILVAACGGSAATPAPSASPTEAPSATPTATPTAEPSATPEPTATETPAGSPTAGRTGRVEFEEDGFAVTLADEWREIPLDEEGFSQILDAVPDAEARAQLEAQLPSLLAAGVKLWAFDLTGTTIGGNLIVLTQPTEIPVSMLKSVAEQGLAGVPGLSGEIEAEDLTVDGVDGVVVAYSLTDTTGTTGDVVAGRQIYVATNDRTYIFTFTDPGDDAADAIDAMIASIDFLP